MTADEDLSEALRSVRQLIARDPRDWSADRHDAFLYGVFIGWRCELDHIHVARCQDRQTDVAHHHGWDDEFVARLDRLHLAIQQALPQQGEAA